MYSVISVLFLIGALMMAVGFLGRIGTDGIGEVDANIASTLGLIFVYAFILISFSSFSELFPIFETIFGGIPYMDKIADYGSLKNVFRQSPLSAATSFLDVVILSAIISLLNLLPLTQGNAVGKCMVKIFTGIVLALVALIILNFIIKGSAVYQWIIYFLSVVITAVSVGTFPLAIISLFKQEGAFGVGIIGMFALFSKSKIAGILRESVLKAVIYVLGIWMLEKYFGDIAAAFSKITVVLVAFGPVFVMLIGIVILLKSVMK